MIPLQFQVDALADAGSYEEALSLCVMCSQDPELLTGIATASIHERYAHDLLSWGDYEGAVGHFLKAGTPCSTVLALFPALVPSELVLPEADTAAAAASASAGVVKPLTGAALSRAASALARYLEKQQAAIRAAAATATAAIAGATATAAPGDSSSPQQQHDASSAAAAAAEQAVIADTVLVSALLHCSPPRREAIVALVSDPRCACDLAATAPLLAAAGVACAEPLLWLYRGRGLHRQALGLLAADRCVGPGGWSLAQYRAWCAAYLRQLWMSEDPSQPPLALQAAAPLLEADPALGLTVFTGNTSSSSSSSSAVAKANTGSSSSTGRGSASRKPKRLVGAGAQPLEAVAFLKSVAVPPAVAAEAVSAALDSGTTGSSEALPLSSGRALAIAYLQYLVDAVAASSSSSGGSSSSSSSAVRHVLHDAAAHSSSTGASLTAQLHDELAYLLMEGLLAEQQQQQQQQQQGSAVLAELYRRRLRAFLQSSTEYNPVRLLAIVPSHFLHEHALLLSRLGRHEEALEIYLRQLKDPALAEQYCDRVWRANKGTACSSITGNTGSTTAAATADADVYLSLVRVYLAGNTAKSSTGSSSNSSTTTAGADVVSQQDGLGAAVALLERWFDRVDPLKALELLPSDAPIGRLSSFLCRAVRHHDSQLRQAQVVHSLCRADFVNAKYELIQVGSHFTLSLTLLRLLLLLILLHISAGTAARGHATASHAMLLAVKCSCAAELRCVSTYSAIYSGSRCISKRF
jgi:tetratricopeptide (TPR) repeat protein